MQVFRKKRAAVHVLPAWQDVDTVEDVLSLMNRNTATVFAKSRTMTCLRMMRTGMPALEGFDGTV
jgi:hypothetical protein